MIQHYLSYFFSKYVSDHSGMVHEWLRLDGWTISKVVISCFSFYWLHDTMLGIRGMILKWANLVSEWVYGYNDFSRRSISWYIMES